MTLPSLDASRMAIIKSVLRPYAHRIDKVGIFGSHATGTARPNSDIDLVLYGRLSEADIDRIWTLFSESALPVGVDVIGYDAALYPPLRAHIDRTARLLLTSDDLSEPKAA